MWYILSLAELVHLREAVQCNVSLLSEYLGSGRSRVPAPPGPRPSAGDDLLSLSRLSLVLSDAVMGSGPVSLSSEDAYLLIGACRMRQAVIREALEKHPALYRSGAVLAAKLPVLDRIITILYDGGINQ